MPNVGDVGTWELRSHRRKTYVRPQASCRLGADDASAVFLLREVFADVSSARKECLKS